MRHNGSGLIAKAARANGSRNGFSVPIAGFHETTTPPIHANHRGYCHGGCTLRVRARAQRSPSAGIVVVQLTRRIRLEQGLCPAACSPLSSRFHPLAQCSSCSSLLLSGEDESWIQKKKRAKRLRRYVVCRVNSNEPCICLPSVSLALCRTLWLLLSGSRLLSRTQGGERVRVSAGGVHHGDVLLVSVRGNVCVCAR